MAKRVAGLTFKGRRFYSRVHIPTDLRGIYGKTEITTPLGLISHPQAEVKHRELEAHYAAQFQAQLHEMGIAPTAPLAPVHPKRLPTPQEVAYIAKESARELLAMDEDVRSRGIRSLDFDVWSSLLAELAQEVTGAIAGERIGDVLQRFREELKAHHLEAPKDIDELRPMVYKWATAHGLALRQVQLRGQGEPVETPEPHPEPESLKAHKAAPAVSKDPSKKIADKLKMRDIFELWRDHEAKRPLKTVSRAELAVSRFEKHTGNPSIGTLTRADGADYRKQLMADKALTPGMASAQLVQMNVLLNFEVDNYQRITVNPWKGLGITVKGKTDRDEWQDHEAVSLFNSPIYLEYDLPTADRAGHDAAYWVPLIGAYTGARISEIAQMLLADVREVEGVTCYQIAVTDEEWQSVKRESSLRVIPVHPDLVRLGFLDYVRDMLALGAERLFPGLTVSENNGAGGGISRWFSDYKIAKGFGRDRVFHCWRNTVETKLQRAREGQLYIDRYLGHKSDGEGRGTYARVRPGDLVGTVSKIQYEGLDLPRVYKAPKWAPGLKLAAPRGRSGKTTKRLA